MSRLSFSWPDAKRSSRLLLFSANISDTGSAPGVGSLVVADILSALIANVVAQRAGERETGGRQPSDDDDDDDEEEDDEAAEDADDEDEGDEEDDEGGEGDGEEEEEAEKPEEEAEEAEEEAPAPPPRRSGRVIHPPVRFAP